MSRKVSLERKVMYTFGKILIGLGFFLIVIGPIAPDYILFIVGFIFLAMGEFIRRTALKDLKPDNSEDDEISFDNDTDQEIMVKCDKCNAINPKTAKYCSICKDNL